MYNNYIIAETVCTQGRNEFVVRNNLPKDLKAKDQFGSELRSQAMIHHLAMISNY